jgi:hypothetical protein
MVDMRAGSAVAQTIPSHTYSAICVVYQPFAASSPVTRRHDRGLVSRQAIVRDDRVLRF